MKVNKICIPLALFLFLLVASCDDIFLDDISDDQVEIVSPQDSLETNQPHQFFLWNKLKGASGYHLLIVSPHLLSASSVVLDTAITANSFSIELSRGEYEWCLKATNEGYETQANCRMLKITL